MEADRAEQAEQAEELQADEQIAAMEDDELAEYSEELLEGSQDEDAIPAAGGGPMAGMPSASTPGFSLSDDDRLASIVESMRNRGHGFHYGDDRAIGVRPNWDAHESEQLYNYATMNNDPGSAHEIGQNWARHGKELEQLSEDLYGAIQELGSAWIGQGAGEAQGWLVGIANAGSEAASATKVMSDRLTEQSTAAAELKKMPQPKEFDAGTETAAMLAGGPAMMVGDLKEKFDEAQETKAQQVAHLEAYTTALSEVDNTTPNFGPESLGLKDAPEGTAPNIDRIGQTGSDGPRIDQSASAGLGGSSAGKAAFSAGGGMSQATTGAPTQAAPAASASFLGAEQGGGGSTSGSGLGVGSSVGLGGAAGAAALGGARVTSGKRGGSKKPGSETAASAETATSANQEPAGTPVTSGQSSASAGPSAPANSGQAPPPAAGPVGGMGAGIAGRTAEGDRDQDQMYSSFLIEPDPDETFGAVGLAAPPVLGAEGEEG